MRHTKNHMQSTSIISWHRSLIVICASIVLLVGNAYCDESQQTPNGAVPDLQLDKPTTNITTSDPLLLLSNSAPLGLLTYLLREKMEGKAVRQNFVVLRSSKTLDMPTGVESYHLSTNFSADRIYKPYLAPNGQYVLFHFGWPYDYPYLYRFYLINRRTQQLQPGPVEYFNGIAPVDWAPDSKSFAFFTGGAEGGLGQLRIFDVEAARSRTVDELPYDGCIAWTSQGTLLYDKQDAGTGQVNIVEAPREGGTAHQLIAQATTPIPAPDGEHILYIGFPIASPQVPHQIPTANEKDKDDKAIKQAIAQGQTQLCLYNRETKIGAVVKLPPELRPVDVGPWLPDSRHVISMYSTGSKGDSSLVVGVLDVTTGNYKKLAQLEREGFFVPENKYGNAPDKLPDLPPPYKHRSYELSFETLRLSRDGKYLVMLQTEIGDVQSNNVLRDSFGYIKAINLQDGTVTLIAQTKNANGLDWTDVPSP